MVIQEYDPNRIVHRKILTAGVKHKCSTCKKIIKKGDVMSYGFPTSDYKHLKCFEKGTIFVI